MGLEYPPDRLRVFVVDDASTDDTPDVVHAKAQQYRPDRAPATGEGRAGQGAHPQPRHPAALDDDWMEALLIMDADVIYRPDSLRRMTRHLADDQVGAVTAFIREGSGKRTPSRGSSPTSTCSRRRPPVARRTSWAPWRASPAVRSCTRARTSRRSAGRSTRAPSPRTPYTTFLTQLAGRRVVFEPAAVVLAEEPDSVAALWKQRLRWERGNVHITRRFRALWFRTARARSRRVRLRDRVVRLSLLPVAMVLAAVGLVGLYFPERSRRSGVPHPWSLAVCTTSS